MTEAETEEVVAGVGHGDQPQLRQGEEQVERQGGDEEGEGDTRQDQRHPLVPLLLLLLSLGVRGEAGVDLEKLQDLGVNHGEDNEREEVLDTEDQDGEGVLHVLVGPGLHTHRVVRPGQGDRLHGLEHQDGRGDGEGYQPYGEIDESHFSVSHFSGKSIADLSDAQPSINSYCSDGTGGHQYVCSLHRGDQLAGQESQVPLPPVQTLDQGGRDTDQGRGDAGDAEVQNINVLGCPMYGAPCNTRRDKTEKCPGLLGGGRAATGQGCES